MGLDTAADVALARYGTTSAPQPARVLRSGEVSLVIEGGAARGISFGGVEVVRGIAYPIRDANWGTLPDRTLDERADADPARLAYERSFEAGEDFRGTFTLGVKSTSDGASMTAQLRLEALRDSCVNRAGFIVLHPLEGVVGQPLRTRKADGTIEEGTFPKRISPGQPVFDIAGLQHEVAGVDVDIRFDGEIFEMEDQRNWSDASYKTYCRPLSRPRPFAVANGEIISQRIEIRLARHRASGGEPSPRPARRGRLPELTLSLDERVAPLDPAAVAPLRQVAFAEALVRFRPDEADAALAAASRSGLPSSLEIVVPADTDLRRALETVAAACQRAEVVPVRVLALPEPYLASHQPEGPWPVGPTPEDAAEAVRASFPTAGVGGGMLTNFTEFNRRPPHHGSDYVSFGTTAIVHAADDASVLETLEAIPDVLASCRGIAGRQPLRLGLMSIGMRSNPYGSDVVENPGRERVAMAREDPRQRGLFAAAFLVGLAGAAAEAGVESLSPAMACGPLGLLGSDGRARPLYHVVRTLAEHAGAEVSVTGRIGGLISLDLTDPVGLAGIVANLGREPMAVEHDGSAVLLSAETVAAAGAPDWLDTARKAKGPVRLEPLDLAFLYSEVRQ